MNKEFCLLLMLAAIAAAAPKSNSSKKCPKNERFMECGTACEPSCANPQPEICTMQCITNVCQCKPDFYRHENGRCVPRDACTPRTSRSIQEAEGTTTEPKKCQENATLKACGTKCPKTCSQPETRPCVRMCNVNVCECNDGFLLDQNTDQCVKPNHCTLN